jgi:hypothetical protein
MSDSLIYEHILEKKASILQDGYFPWEVGDITWLYIRKIFIFLGFLNTIWLNSNLSQFWWGRALIHTFVSRIQILIMHYAYNPPGVPSRIFSQKLRPFSMVPRVQIWIKVPQIQNKISYIARRGFPPDSLKRARGKGHPYLAHVLRRIPPIVRALEASSEVHHSRFVST